MKSFNKSGFTLAEVLITLTIIGIIAALTIPTLMTKYNDHVTATKVKKSYSILANAIKMAEQQEGQLVQDMRNDYYYKWQNEAGIRDIMNSFIRGKKMGSMQIFSEDGLLYDFTMPSLITVDVGGKIVMQDTGRSFFGIDIPDLPDDGEIEIPRFEDNLGLYEFAYFPEYGLLPQGAPNSSGNLLEKSTVCPGHGTMGTPRGCTYWTIRTGKVQKKAGEWFDSK